MDDTIRSTNNETQVLPNEYHHHNVKHHSNSSKISKNMNDSANISLHENEKYEEDKFEEDKADGSNTGTSMNHHNYHFCCILRDDNDDYNTIESILLCS
jgi:hypothetical protein